MPSSRPAQKNPYLKAGAEDAAARALELGHEVMLLVHDDNANKRSELNDSAIAAGVMAEVPDKLGADALVAAVQKAMDMAIPLVKIDRKITQLGVTMVLFASSGDQVTHLRA